MCKFITYIFINFALDVNPVDILFGNICIVATTFVLVSTDCVICSRKDENAKNGNCQAWIKQRNNWISQ